MSTSASPIRAARCRWASIIGGYKLAFVNNAAFPNNKVLQVYWAGVKYMITPQRRTHGGLLWLPSEQLWDRRHRGMHHQHRGNVLRHTDDYFGDGVWQMSKRFSSYLA